MVSKLFSTSRGSNVKAANTVNNAGGKAYLLSDKSALAQYALTGCFNGTYYTSAEDQLKNVLALAEKVDDLFIAKLAVYARQEGLMKDMPAFLAAILAVRNVELLKQVFPKVVDSPKMVRNFVQILRSGVVGRKSLGTAPKKLVQKYLESLTDEQLFKADVGNNPSLQDIVKMVHPKPSDAARSAMYAYLLDKPFNSEDLLPLVKEFEAFKKGESKEVPNVPFQMLTALPLTEDNWKKIAENATWNQSRMNLNTFLRHGVFNDSKLVKSIADKLANPVMIKKSKAFPYQLFTAFQNIDAGVPNSISNALQKAAEVSVDNVPAIEGKVYVMVDVSGSMGSPATGNRVGSVSSKMRCVDVAALVASSFLRKNPDNTVIMPFDTRVHHVKLNPLDSVMTNAATLAKFGGGGTDCSLPLAELNASKAKGDVVIYVSDNESWADRGYGSKTGLMAEWVEFKKRNPKAKLVCIDINPSSTSQVDDGNDRLNVGGFSDQIYDVIAKFVEFGSNKDLWVKAVETVSL